MKAKRNTLGLVATLVLALVGAALVVTYLRGSDSSAEQAGDTETTPVLVVVDTIAAGRTADDIAASADRFLAVRDLPAEQVLGDAMTEVSQLDALSGLLTIVEITPGEQLLQSRFVPPSEISRNLTQIEVPENLLTTTFALEPQRALGGNLRAGATVAVIAAFDADGEEPAVTKVVLDKALVTNVQVESLFTEEQLSNDPLNPSLAPQGRLLVTLGLGAKETEALAYALEYGRVWLAGQPQTAEEADAEPVTREDVLRGTSGDNASAPAAGADEESDD